MRLTNYKPIAREIEGPLGVVEGALLTQAEGLNYVVEITH